MWKDFFYFSKSERRAVLFLLTLLFVFICMWVLFPVKEEETLEQDQEGIEEIKNFLAGVHEMEERQSLQYSYDKPKKRKVVLAAFDPNSADSIDFLQRGLPPFIAHTILQYRRAGGKFRTADDFSRVYGLSSEEFKILKPYIRIAEVFRRKQDTLHAVKKMRKDTLAVYKYPEGTLVDLNEADTTELKKIPGIGSGIARMIVAYRNRLGGFYDTAQLKEVDYVNEDMLKWFKLENASIHRINANKAGLDKLRSHPYNFYKALVIMDYRRKKGKLKSLSQLSLYEEFTEKDLERLSYYLTFD